MCFEGGKGEGGGPASERARARVRECVRALVCEHVQCVLLIPRAVVGAQWGWFGTLACACACESVRVGGRARATRRLGGFAFPLPPRAAGQLRRVVQRGAGK